MIEIQWPLLLAQIATFLVAMFLVWRFAWGPLQQLMQARTQKLAEDLKRAETGRREIEALEAEVRQRLSEIEEQARAAVNQAVQQGNLSKEAILQTARAEAQRVLEKAQGELEIERERVVRELRGQMADLSLAMVEKLLGEGLDRKLQARVLDDFLKDLEGVKRPS